MKEINKPNVHLAKVIGWVIVLYGVSLLASNLLRLIDIHNHRIVGEYLRIIPTILGISFVYLGSLLTRLKTNAWRVAILLTGVTGVYGTFIAVAHESRLDAHPTEAFLHIVIPVLLCALLYVSRAAFRVKSDVVGFHQAIRLSGIVIAIAFIYGVVGFLILDRHDFHQNLSVLAAIHQTFDQIGITTNVVTPHSARAHVFLDSLWLLSWSAAIYVIISFFQPIRARFTGHSEERILVNELLHKFPSDVDDFFKLWPHDKQYFFDSSHRAGLAYKVTVGVALVVADPFGDSKRFSVLLSMFQDFCFVNDWQPCFVHVGTSHQKLYELHQYTLQKIGEEAVVSVDGWAASQTGKPGKYFREIRNKFTKLGYRVEIVSAPHETKLIDELRVISGQWLEKPGREERGFMLGYFNTAYLQQCDVAVIRDDTGKIKGFLNLVPTYETKTANYDLLRCSTSAPGNCGDFLVISVLDSLASRGYLTFNMGLSPLAGLNQPNDQGNAVVSAALKLLFSKGDRIYSFNGLRRFKDKYNPEWQPRYIAYQGGVRNFTKAAAALNRAMRVK